MTKLRIAVQGCCHGELDKIFEKVRDLHKQQAIDLLLILGDFQSLRSEEDFQSISIPPKYQKLGDFRKYYNDSDLEPCVPTIFIGGNHESMRHLMLLPYGGYASNNIYYMGYSNVIWFKGLRIGGISGILKHWDLNKPRYDYDYLEKQNKWNDNVKSLYHVRKNDLLPLYMMSSSSDSTAAGVDIMMSHDWPTGIVYHGNYQQLIKTKPYFKKDILYNQSLGSELNWELLNLLKPKWWLSAHLHVRYTANIKHEVKKRKRSDEENKDEISLDLDDSDGTDDTTDINDPVNTDNRVKETNFLALDKCLPKRKHLEIIELQTDETHISYTSTQMYHDPEFIKNLKHLHKNKILHNFKNKKLNEIDIIELTNDRPNLTDTEHLDWNNYKIPNYTKDIQKNELQQTNTFIDKYLS